MFGIFCLANFTFVWFFIKETKGRTLEDMDIIFGTVQAEQRAADIEAMVHKQQMHGDEVEHVDVVSESKAAEAGATREVEETPASTNIDEKAVH